MGFGDINFEDSRVEIKQTFKYSAYKTFLVFMTLCFFALEIAAAIFADLPEDVKSDSISLLFIHSSDAVKVIIFVYLKKRYVVLLGQIILCDCHETKANMKSKYTLIKYTTIIYGGQILLCIVFYNMHAVWRALQPDSKYIGIVLYYPKYESEGVFALTCRVLASVLPGSLLPLIHVSITCLLVCVLIMVRYKFVSLRKYFLSLSEIRKEDGTMDEEEFRVRFIEGVVMHQQVLRITKELEALLSPTICIFFYQSYLVSLSMLFSFVTSENKNMSNLFRCLLLVASVLFVLALYLCNAGEISRQSQELSLGIMYSGWSRCRSPQVRQLVLLPLLVCTKPLSLKALGIYRLNYSTFISVVKSVYSVFMLVYTRNE